MLKIVQHDKYSYAFHGSNYREGEKAATQSGGNHAFRWPSQVTGSPEHHFASSWASLPGGQHQLELQSTLPTQSSLITPHQWTGWTAGFCLCAEPTDTHAVWFLSGPSSSMDSNDLKARVLHPRLLCSQDCPATSSMSRRLAIGRHIFFWKQPMREVTRGLKGHETFASTWSQQVLGGRDWWPC